MVTPTMFISLHIDGSVFERYPLDKLPIFDKATEHNKHKGAMIRVYIKDD